MLKALFAKSTKVSMCSQPLYREEIMYKDTEPVISYVHGFLKISFGLIVRCCLTVLMLLILISLKNDFPKIIYKTDFFKLSKSDICFKYCYILCTGIVLYEPVGSLCLSS